MRNITATCVASALGRSEQVRTCLELVQTPSQAVELILHQRCLHSRWNAFKVLLRLSRLTKICHLNGDKRPQRCAKTSIFQLERVVMAAVNYA